MPDFTRELQRWFAARDADGRLPRPQEDLLDGGWLDSLGVLDLLLFLEELRDGVPVEVRRLQPGQLRSVEALTRNFLEVPDARA